MEWRRLFSEPSPQGEDARVDDVYHDEAAVYDSDGIVDANPALRIDGDGDTAEQINRELKKLQDFRHPDIDTEVWFVGLGAEQHSHSASTHSWKSMQMR